ncbi:MAG TPA: GNAT family N-acetyltransferase [Steroidobacteraceae bacterium]|jgi:ribosomal-protein-alanine N-acetyltransferase|nr:GNAT family N-acetyltransferase [Steroidobacteraceae bacterium]
MSVAVGSTAAPTSVLETARLRLRHVGDDDAPFILALLNDRGWLRYIGDRGVRTLEDARKYIAQGPRKMYAEHGFGLFLVERKDDGASLGLCGLIRRDTLPDVDIGFALAEQFRGHGYAHEAAAATLRYAREVRKLGRVVAIAMPENTASTRLLERLGLQFERTITFGPAAEVLNYFGTTPAFAFDAENVHAVDEKLWTSGQLSPRDIERLPDIGIEAVVNLALPTSSNALPGEAEAITALGLPYVQIPVPWERPEPHHLRQFFGVMDAFDGRKVWVHCAKNMRVSAFVYLYRRLRRGEPDAVARHPMDEVWEPTGTWRAFIDQALRELPRS